MYPVCGRAGQWQEKGRGVDERTRGGGLLPVLRRFVRPAIVIVIVIVT